MSDITRSARRCPLCGWAIVRIPRRPEDRIASETAPIRRYRCCDWGGCGWEGTLVATWADTRIQRRRGRDLARVLVARTCFVFCAAIGFGAITMGAGGVNGTFAPTLPAQNAQTIPFGVSDFGRPLTENHPFLQQDVDATARVVKTAAPATDSSAGAATKPGAVTKPAASSNDTPLSLREDCAWGEPGRSPYRGTVHQALTAARLPAHVVALFEHKIRDRDMRDRLEIRNEAIRGVHTDAAFDARGFKMTFGKTLCLNSRVNFKPGHVELADLYEVTDAHGITYSVMVPDVCGNVSVLGERVNADAMPQHVMAPPIEQSRSGAPGVRSGPPGVPSGPPGVPSGPPGLPSGPPGAPTGPPGLPNGPPGVPTGPEDVPSGPQSVPSLVPFTAPLDVNSVPEPESWTLMLGGVALLGWFTRRRRRESRHR